MSTHTRPSSSTSTSIRSPGPYGGSPDRNRRLRSERRSLRDTPNNRVSSSTLVPWCLTRYGTTSSSRWSRAEDFDPESSPGGKGRLQPAADLRSELFRSEGLGVRAERQHPRGQALGGSTRHRDLDPPVA